MKRCLVLILCLALLPSAAAFAQQPNDPATRQDVQRLFDVMHLHRQMDAAMALIKEQLPLLSKSPMAKQSPNMTPEQQAMLNDFVLLEIQKMYDKMPFDDLMQAVIPVYQRHYTHGEIQAITRFYASPAGQKMLKESPTITFESFKAAAPILQSWMQSQAGEMKASAEEFSGKMKQFAPPPPKQMKEPPASLTQPLN